MLKNNAIYTSNGALVYDGLNDVIQSSPHLEKIFIYQVLRKFTAILIKKIIKKILLENTKRMSMIEVKISTSRKIVHHVLHNKANSKNLEKALLKAKID